MAVEVTLHLNAASTGNLGSVTTRVVPGPGTNRYILAGVNYEASPPISTQSMTYGGQPMTLIGFATVSNPDGSIRGDIVFFGIGETGIASATSDIVEPTFAGATAPIGMAVTATMNGVNQSNPFKATMSDVGGDGNPGTNADIRTVDQPVDAGGAIFANVNLGLDSRPINWGMSLSNRGPAVAVGDQTATYANSWGMFAEAATVAVSCTTSGNNRGALLTVAINPAEAAPPSTGRITRLDGWDLVATNQTSARNGQSFPVSAGNNRLLVVTYSDLSDGNLPSAMRFGGQTMTPRVDLAVTDGRQIGASLWTLGEAGIAAASGNQIQATVPTTTNSEIDLFAASYQNVDQNDTVVDSDSGRQGGGSPAVAQLKNFTTTDGGIGIFHWANERGTTAPSASWDNATEVEEAFGPLTYTSIAEVSTTGQLVFPTVDPASVHFRNVIIGIILRAAEATSGGVQQFEATGGAVSTGTLSSFVVAGQDELAAQGVAVSTGSVRFLVRTPVNPNDVTIGTLIGEATSTGSFNTTQVISMQFRGGAVSAGFFEFVGGGVDLVSPLDQRFTIADSFVSTEKPVILIDLFFDEGEVNIWTRPFEGEFEGRNYQPIGGVTGSLSIRQNLDQPGFESSVQLSGLSPEIVAIGNRSQFQMRPANIRLGNIGSNDEVFIAETIVPGRIQNITVVDDLDDPSVSIEIDSIFNDINLPRARRLSSSDQKRFHPEDTFFDFVESARMQTPRFGG